MGLLQPAPAVIGAVSLTAIVGLIVLVHFIFCVVILGNVDSEKAITVSGVQISTMLQCAGGAFCLIGLPLTVHGGVGAIYRVPSHLNTYLMYQFLSLLAGASFLISVAANQRPCHTRESIVPGELATMVCGLPSGGALVLLAIFLVVVCVAMYLVWSLTENTKKRLETDLFRYQEPLQLKAQMGEDAMAQATKNATGGVAAAHRMGVPGALWSSAALCFLA